MTHTPNLRPPKQARSRQTLSRLIRAAAELLAEQGVEATTVQDIVSRAGSSVGSFYARFDGKDDLLHYLEERVWSEARERWDAAMETGGLNGLSLADLVPAVVLVLQDVVRHGAATRRALRGRRSAGAASEAAARFQAHVRDGMAGLLAARSHEIAHPDPGRAADVGLRIILASLRGPDAWADVEHGVPVSELSRALLGYLGYTGPVVLPDPGPEVSDDAGSPPGQAISDYQRTEPPGSDHAGGDSHDLDTLDFFDVWG